MKKKYIGFRVKRDFPFRPLIVVSPLTRDKIKTVSEVEYFDNKGILDARIKSKGNTKTIFKGVDIDDVRKAVRGLIEEIEGNKKRKDYSMLDEMTKMRMQRYKRILLEDVEGLIFRWFDGVFE